VKEDHDDVLHRGTLQSIVGLDKQTGALFDRSVYEFAIHTKNQHFLRITEFSLPTMKYFLHCCVIAV